MFPMADIVVVLPGITGSVLKKDGKGLWEVSGGAVFRALRSRAQNLQDLALPAVDDPALDDLGDGVTATALMPDIHLIPSLWRIDGYGKIGKTLTSRFAVEPGKNYFEFPYDWRRDNRVHARRLRRESHIWLKNWRESSGNPDAKLILVAHSMGGIVARSFLELEDGWKDTRALVTFGTPFAGSLNAADFVVNGFKKGVGPLKVDLSDAMRSMTSVYQLLPVYPSISIDGGALVRPAESDGLPHLDKARAEAAWVFHRLLNDEADRAVRDGEPRGEIIPIVGYAQPTSQSARLVGGRLEMARTINGQNPGGDGTVPRPSATPPIANGVPGPKPVMAAESHGSLQNVGALLNHLVGSFAPTVQAEAFRAFDQTLSLSCDDVFAADEDIVVEAACSEPDAELTVRIEDPAAGVVAERIVDADGDDWVSATFPPMPEGTYRVRVSSSADAAPVTDTFTTFSEQD